MTETDDKLLKQFFSEQKQEIKDDGSSHRVMRNLPERSHRLIQVWGTVCTVLCVILFFAFRGLQATISTLREVLVPMVQHELTAGFDPKSLYIAILVPVFFGACKAWSMAWCGDNPETVQGFVHNSPKRQVKNLLSESGYVIFVNKIHTIYSI